MTKKKKIILIICAVVSLLIIGSLFYLYHYEREYVGDSVAITVDMNEWKAKYMDIYRKSYFGSSESEGIKPDNDEISITLSEEQRQAVNGVLENKTLEAYTRLWYRYDAVIMYDDEVAYKIDLKNKIVFREGVYVGATQNPLNIVMLRGCVELTDEENEILKNIIEGNGK